MGLQGEPAMQGDFALRRRVAKRYYSTMARALCGAGVLRAKRAKLARRLRRPKDCPLSPLHGDIPEEPGFGADAVPIALQLQLRLDNRPN